MLATIVKFILASLSISQLSVAAVPAPCLTALAKTITGSQRAKNFYVQTKVNGKKIKLSGSINPETELRIMLPKPAEQVLAEHLKGADWSIASVSMPLKEARKKQLRQHDQSIMVNPLKSENEKWHGTTFDPTPNMPGAFYKNIVIRSETDPDGNTHQNSAIVGAQYEISTYFDTVDAHLSKHKMAIRIKTWYPYSVRYGQEFKASGTSLFIKLDTGSSNLFHERMEVQIKLPANITETDLNNIVESTLKTLGWKGTANKLKLRPIVEVLNLRLTANLFLDTATKEYLATDIKYGREKIGFITFDSFMALNPSNMLKVLNISEDLFKSKNAMHQIEMEFTPEGKSLLGDNLNAWQTQLQHFASQHGGKITQTPKYKSALRALKK
ncbi:MAG: hypothetical protein IPM57_07145 [Oligoflexia bacterium]|nr:hypothetical protein [Oligoflexia bacterium]